MTATSLPWNLAFGGTHQEALTASGTPPGDTVQTSLNLGIRAVELLRHSSYAVGPVGCCVTHAFAHIAVEPGTSHRWQAPQTLVHAGRPSCQTNDRPSYGPNCRLLWITPYGHNPAATDSAALHHALALTRSHGRHAA